MIKTILTAAKSAISQPISQPAATPPETLAEPRPIAPERAPGTVLQAARDDHETDFSIISKTSPPEPEAILKAAPKTAKTLAVETAVQVGYSAGDEVAAVIRRHQPARHPRMLFVDVPDWSEPVVCWVKDAASWQPVNPPYDRLKARWSGMADVEGRLIFESADECKKSRLIRRK
jgi:hypothetical protein